MFSPDLFVLASRATAHDTRQRFDGWFNNLGNPSWGAAGNNLFCILPLGLSISLEWESLANGFTHTHCGSSKYHYEYNILAYKKISTIKPAEISALYLLFDHN